MAQTKKKAPRKKAARNPPQKKTILAAQKIMVSRQYLKSGQDDPDDVRNSTENEMQQVHKFATPPASVTVNYGLTINLGNYESARIEVGATFPCYVEEVDAAYDTAKAFVEKRVKSEVADVRKGGAIVADF